MRKKTILITAFSRQQVKDVLLSDIRYKLEKEDSIQIVFLVPLYRVSEYEKTFKEKDILFYGIDDIVQCVSQYDTFFKRLSRYYINVPITQGSVEKKKGMSRIISKLLLLAFGNVSSIRTFSRFLDIKMVRNKQYNSLFEKCRPDLVFVSRLDAPLDQTILREAKRRNIRTVGMVNAWNLAVPKRFIWRLLPGTIIVWNKAVKNYIAEHCDIPNNRFFISGIPRLDRYLKKPRVSKQTFYKEFGIDVSKKIILFISLPSINNTEHIILHKLESAIHTGALPRDIVILVRNYPDEDKVKGALLRGNVGPSSRIIFDNARTFWGSGKTHTTGLLEDMDHAANSLFHAALVITTEDTMGVDARFFGTPIIDLSAERQNTDELIKDIKKHFFNSGKKAKERKKTTHVQSHVPDGKTGERIARFILTVCN